MNVTQSLPSSPTTAPPHNLAERLAGMCRGRPPLRLAVAHPCSMEVLEAVIDARNEGLITPLLVGPEARIRLLAQQAHLDLQDVEFLPTAHSHASAEAAVASIRSGQCNALMKGSLHTDELMHPVLDKDKGLRTERRVTHVFVVDVPSYPRPLLITDAAINIYPRLIDKRDIVQNAIDLALAIGIVAPRVALLSAAETVNPAITSTIDAAALCKMADRGQIRGGRLDGPLAFDTAVNAEAARIKELKSDVAGVADILVVPDLEAGNMLVKQLTFLAGADAAGIVVGARVPIVLTSRADGARSRLASIALAMVLTQAAASPSS